MLTIRRATEADWDEIWKIFHAVVREGDTYSYDPATTQEQGRALWMSPPASAYVACRGDQVVGTYYFKPNQPGLGSHVANAGYMVDSGEAGRGVGRAMCEHSLEEARRAGFLAMQFNFVVSTNERAVALWQKMGFRIVGTLPKAFRHSRLGLVDAYVMHRFLNEPDPGP
ncbi:MAG TPA: GNAT family N-acetyltransferase [Thermoanaerobaculia bacterium]|nr:GNAT family N-acetyltransferase [Thermoanaerobaculia bacterium]